MAIAVRRLAERPGLGLSLIAGSDGADRSVEWAHSIELADPTPWLDGGELVMTTGLKIGPTASEQFDYVARLAHAGSVALAFDTGTTYKRVPAGILSAGDSLGLPILAVPPSTPFIAIARTVIEELTADQVRAVQRVVDQQENLTRATLKGGIPAVVSTLARVLSGAIAVVSTESQILAAHGNSAATAVDYARSIAESARSTTGKRGQVGRVFVDHHGYCTVQSITVSRDVQAYFSVSCRDPLSASDRLLVAHAVSLVSIELGKPAKVADAEQRLRNVALAALIDIGPRLDAGVLRYFGFDPDSQVVGFVLSNLGPLITAEEQIAAHFTARSTPYLTTQSDNQLVLLLPARDIGGTGSELRDTLAAHLQRPVRVGQGTAVPLAEAACSVRQASLAASSGSGPEHIAFENTGPVSHFLGNQSLDDLQAIEHAALGALDVYDSRTHGSSKLVGTLASFLEHNGERELAATSLGVHRHTMRNRMLKIAELTGYDLDSVHVRTELWLALKIREMLRSSRHIA